jgi:hypothetical protein
MAAKRLAAIKRLLENEGVAKVHNTREKFA